MAVTILRKGKPPVQLIAQVGACEPTWWPFPLVPGQKHILNPVNRKCVRCGDKLPDSYTEVQMIVPEALRHQIKAKTLQEEVGL